MKFLFDFFPIACFFVAFLLWGIYAATAATMAASVLQVGVYWLKHRKFEKLHVIVLVFVLTLGSLTLISHNPIFIKWKPTFVYWAFAVVLTGSHWIGSYPMIRRLLHDKVQLPDGIWRGLNISWAIFFLIMGMVNLIVAYKTSTTTWVYFKLFGTLGATLLLILAQVCYIAIYMKSAEKEQRKIQR
jgi:intracellular septation protein